MKWNPIAGAGLAFLAILSATGCSKIAPISAPGGRGGCALQATGAASPRPTTVRPPAAECSPCG